MKLSENIAKSQALLAEHGDLYILSGENYAVTSLRVEEVDEDDVYPSDYQMPAGFKFVRLS